MRYSFSRTIDALREDAGHGLTTGRRHPWSMQGAVGERRDQHDAARTSSAHADPAGPLRAVPIKAMGVT